MRRLAAIALVLGLAALGRAEGGVSPTAAAPLSPPAAAPLSPSAAGPAAAAALSPTAWSEHGLEYRFSLSALSLSNASPLAYCPLELGWRFANGVRLRSGLDLFYYEAMDGKPPVAYSYGMQDWRSTLAYEVPLPFALRPVVGVSAEFFWGGKQLAHPAPNTSNNASGSWSGLGAGGVLGLEWRGGAHWAVSSLARYTVFASPGPLAAVDLGIHYLY